MPTRDYDFALGQLRHLYQQMLDGQVKDTKQAAKYLLGPAIEILERRAPAPKEHDAHCRCRHCE